MRTWRERAARCGRVLALLALSLAAPSRALAQAPSTQALVSSRPGAPTNRPITFTATVSPASPGAGVPSGLVTFSDDATTLGAAALLDGVATLTVRSLAKGSHQIAAAYAGDAQFLPSSGALPGGQLVPDSPPIAGAGQALVLDGETEEARLEDPTGALDEVRTVELWFQDQPRSPSSVSCLVQQGEGDGLRFGLCLSAERDRLIIRRGFETTFIPITIGPGWHHLALAAGEVDTLIHLDGTVFSPLLGTLRSRTRQPLVIGAAPEGAGAADRFPGALDELRLWSTSRSAEELEASARQPVPGDAPGLLGLWRMDEGEGTSLFDAAPSHLEATLTAPGGPTWVPSGAWIRRVITWPRRLAPFLAGYDPDGDPFTVTLPVPPLHGVAAVAGPAIAYDPELEFVGLDAFTCEVANGPFTSRYTTDVEVPAVTVCQAQLDCGAGLACLNGECVPAGRLRTASGAAGCSSSGQGASAALAGLLLTLGLRSRRSARRRP